jgi:hypothetical protein
MAVYNGERFLGEAVESILGQSFGDFEFIIIDDGSTDGSTALLGAFAERDARIGVYRQENKGLVESLNRGCALARGTYLARMDADDIAVEDRLKWQLYFLETHPEVGLLSGAAEFIDAAGNPVYVAANPCSDREIQRALPDGNVIWHPAVMMRKDVFVAAGAYRHLKDAEDYDLWLRMAELTRTANLPQVILRYRLHAGQVSVRKSREQALGTGMARVAAAYRRSGKPDPFDPAREITPALLTALGVSAAEQQTTMARGYLSCVRNMCRAGEYAMALETLNLLHSSQFKQADRWVLADSFLWESKVFFRQNKILDCIVSAARAVIMRPVIMGRPLKAILGRLRALREVDADAES